MTTVARVAAEDAAVLPRVDTALPVTTVHPKAAVPPVLRSMLSLAGGAVMPPAVTVFPMTDRDPQRHYDLINNDQCAFIDEPRVASP